MKDLDTLCKMYESARQFMAFHGNPQQWGQTYPKRTLTESDIASGCSYVCEDQGRIIATFYYREGPDDTYLRIYDGEWLNAEPYGVVHRITSDGTVKGDKKKRRKKRQRNSPRNRKSTATKKKRAE